ncbi:hypothetical protein KR044_000600, partial [Drosophila immigrans]
KLKKFNDEIETMRLELCETLIGLKSRQKRLNNILEKASAESNTLEEFEQKYEEFKQAEDKKRINVKTTSEFKEFKQQLTHNNNTSTSNADDVHIEAEIAEQSDDVCSMYDPWTKGLMLNPVRNIKCGHHYDRDSVMAVIKDTMSVHCPIVGCAIKAYVHPNHLVPNQALQKKIRSYKAQQDEHEYEDDE